MIYQLNTLSTIQHNSKIVNDFEKKFDFEIPSIYKQFIINFDVSFWNNRRFEFFECLIKSNFSIENLNYYGVYIGTKPNFGLPDLWGFTHYFEECLIEKQVYMIFDDDLSFRENGFFAIGNYDNHNYYFVGINPDNKDKIYYFDKDLYDTPKLICNNIFEFLTFFIKTTTIDMPKGYTKSIGDRFFTNNEEWKIHPEIFNEIINNAFLSDFKDIREIIKIDLKLEFNILYSQRVFEKVSKRYEMLVNDTVLNPHKIIYNTRTLVDCLKDDIISLGLNPLQFPKLNNEIRFAILNIKVGLYYFYIVKNQNVFVFDCYEFLELQLKN